MEQAYSTTSVEQEATAEEETVQQATGGRSGSTWGVASATTTTLGGADAAIWKGDRIRRMALMTTPAASPTQVARRTPPARPLANPPSSATLGQRWFQDCGEPRSGGRAPCLSFRFFSCPFCSFLVAPSLPSETFSCRCITDSCENRI